MTKDEYTKRLEEILNTVWDEACDMMEDGGTVDISRPEAITAIQQLNNEAIGADKQFRNVYQWQQDEPLNLLRQELRNILGVSND